MARISSYPFDTNVTDNDAWIGTNAANRQTKQFTASAVANYLNLNAKVNIGGQMSFKWSDTENGGLGTISKTGGGGSGDNFNTLTEIRLSKDEINGQRVVEFLEYLTTTDILIGQGNEISQFGHYKLDTYVVDPATASYYIAGITFIGGNGVIAEQGTQYTVIDFNIASGDVNLRQNFGSSNQWVINNTTGKATPSVTLVNAQEEIIHGCVDYTNATTITVDFDTNVTGSSFLN
jgi:hypothetical protein|tara:strand:+ start:383 stop:1084 length:702 start_codon:yes stop_codon:yes gene_type:complete